MSFPPVKEQLDRIIRNTVEVISEEELEQKLTRSFETRTPLKIKNSVPTRPDPTCTSVTPLSCRSSGISRIWDTKLFSLSVTLRP